MVGMRSFLAETDKGAAACFRALKGAQSACMGSQPRQAGLVGRQNPPWGGGGGVGGPSLLPSTPSPAPHGRRRHLIIVRVWNGQDEVVRVTRVMVVCSPCQASPHGSRHQGAHCIAHLRVPVILAGATDLAVEG